MFLLYQKYYPYLYFAIWAACCRDLILVGPRLTQELRPEGNVASAASQTSTPSFSVAVPQQGEARTERRASWDVDAQTVIRHTVEMPLAGSFS